jgi:hypothetical protein
VGPRGAGAAGRGCVVPLAAACSHGPVSFPTPHISSIRLIPFGRLLLHSFRGLLGVVKECAVMSWLAFRCCGVKDFDRMDFFYLCIQMKEKK